MSPLVHPLGPTTLIHRIPVTPVRIGLPDGCELQIAPVPASVEGRLAGIQNTLLYVFTGIGLGRLLTSYTGISEQVSGHRVITSLRQRVTQMRPAALIALTRAVPYSFDFLLHLESAVLKHLAMRTRPLNARTSVGEASARLTPAQRALADALARQIADAVSAFALGGMHNRTAWGYRNARDLAATHIHRLGGRAVDTCQVVDLLTAAGASLTSLRQPFVQRRDLIQREKDGGNVRVQHVKVDGLAVFYPAGILTPAQAEADYAAQRRRHPRGRLPLPAPATEQWCPCPYCTPSTTFSRADALAPATA